MKTSRLMRALFLSGFLQAQNDALPAPHFHHLHLNSVNPDAAIDFYTQQLRREGVNFLKEPYMLGDMRAVMIEGPAAKHWNWWK